MIKGVWMDLGGQIYTVPPLSLGAVEALQDRLASFTGGDLKSVGTVIDALHMALVRNYPEITREQVAEMVDLGTMQEIMEAVMDVSGLKRKAQLKQKARKKGEVLPGSV
jgi:hypothetical protein